MRIPAAHLTIAAVLLLAAAGAGANYVHNADHEAPSGELHLVLNVAAGRLAVYEDGEHTRTYKVSVGLRGWETPAGEYRIRDVVWNPWWHPPNSEWARGRTPTAPGSPDNPMGRIKLNFAPLLYIHGTQETQALGGPASRGCVRMRNEDVIELTRLVHRYASPRVSDSVLDQLESSPRTTRTIRLERAVRFTANYAVAAVEDGFLIIYPDIYGLVRQQVRDEVELVLRDEGIDARRMHQPTLERLLEKSGSRRVAIALDDLKNGAPGVPVTPESEH